MAKLIVAAVVSYRVRYGLRTLLAGVIVALEQLHTGIAHWLAIVIVDGAFDDGIGNQAKENVSTVKAGADGDAGEEVSMLVDALRSVSAGGGGKGILSRRQRGKCEASVRAGLNRLRGLAIVGRVDEDRNIR